MSECDQLWTRQAAQWERLTSPGRPCGDDLAFFDGLANDFAARHSAPRVLLLGATPELATLAWPSGTDLLAVDRCPRMLSTVWPGYPRPGDGAFLTIGCGCRWRMNRATSSSPTVVSGFCPIHKFTEGWLPPLPRS